MNTHRRHFMCLAAAAATLPLATAAGAQAAPRRIGMVNGAQPAAMAAGLDMARAWLTAKGLQEGRDYLIDAVHAEGRLEDLPRLAAELGARRPAVVITPFGPQVLRAIAQVPVVVMGATPALPLQMAEQGFAGRVTGVDFNVAELEIKRLHLLAELLPAGAKVLGLAHPVVRDNPRLGPVRALAARLGLDYQIHFVGSPAEIESTMGLAKASGAQAVQQLAAQVLHAQRATIIAQADRLGLPTMYEWPESVHEGGLISLGVDRLESWSRLMHQVWHLAQGGAVSEVPVVLASAPRLVVNRRTAAALALPFPNAVLQRAHEVVG